MKENIPGYPGYHITKDGKVYTHNILQAYRDGNLKTPSALIARGEAHSNSSITNQTRNMIVDLRINYKVPESKLSIIFGISKRHINKIVSQYKSGIRWDNNPIKT